MEIKEYIRDNKVASISEISDKFEVSTKQIEQWVREERLCFTDDSPIGLQCECCGAAPRAGRDRDNARMRFLDR